MRMMMAVTAMMMMTMTDEDRQAMMMMLTDGDDDDAETAMTMAMLMMMTATKKKHATPKQPLLRDSQGQATAVTRPPGASHQFPDQRARRSLLTALVEWRTLWMRIGSCMYSS